LLLLARDGRLKIFALLLYFAVFFEELVKQHRVHCFVAHRVGLALLVTDH